MEYLRHAFSLQLTDETDLIVLQSIEMALRHGKYDDGIDRMLARFNKDFASRAESYSKPWFTSLITAIRPYYIKELDCDTGEPISDVYDNAFNSFIEAMIKRLNGNRSIFMMFGKDYQFSLEHFTQEELAQPHMQWLPLFYARHQALRATFPTVKNLIGMACIHPSHAIPDTMLLALKQSYHADNDQGFDTVMSYVSYVDWYINSRGHFEIEDVRIEPEYASRMERTLEAWHESRPDEPIETHVDWLCRNYEFHPQHRAFVLQWATEHLEKVARQ